MGAEAFGKRAHPLDRCLAALTDDVGGAERFRQGNPVRVTIQENDLLGAETPGGNHAAQANRTAADHRHGLAGADFG